MGLPRALHPLAWWLWGLLVAAAALQSTNLVVSAAVIAGTGLVVAARAPDTPWLRAYSLSLRLGLIVVLVRVAIQVVFAPRTPGTELFSLPSVELPTWMAGISLGGTVTAESMLAAAGQGLRLAAVLCTFGAVNSLTSPARTVRALPAALYTAGVAVSVAMLVAPQAVIAAKRRLDGRRLRGLRVVGLRSAIAVVSAVIGDSLARAVDLAASMEIRGFGHHEGPGPGLGWTAAVGGASCGLAVGLYGWFEGGARWALALVIVGAGGLGALLWSEGRRTRRVRYRPDHWRGSEWMLVATAAALALAISVAMGRGVVADAGPLVWPTAPWWVLLACAGAFSSAWWLPEPHHDAAPPSEVVASQPRVASGSVR